MVVIGREFLVSGLRSIAASEGFTIEASELGKFKMVVQIVSVVAVILDHRWKEWPVYGHYFFPIHWIAYLAIWFMVCVSLVSAIDYFVAFWSKIDQRVVKRRRRAFILSRRRKPVPSGAGGPRCRCLDLVPQPRSPANSHALNSRTPSARCCFAWLTIPFSPHSNNARYPARTARPIISPNHAAHSRHFTCAASCADASATFFL